MTKAIEDANELYTKAIEGTEVGQFAAGSRAILRAAIDEAQLVVNDAANKTANQLTIAKEILDQAIVAFEAGKANAGDATTLILAIQEATALHADAAEGIIVGQYVVGSKALLKAAIDNAQIVVNDAMNKTDKQLADAEAQLSLAISTFSISKVVELTGFTNVTITETASDSSNRVILENGESLIITSSDESNAFATVLEAPSGIIQVTGVAAGGPINIAVQVKKDGQVIKTGTFTVTIVAPTMPMSITSKMITDLDFSNVQATQAKLISKDVTVRDFTNDPKNFTITVKKGDRVDVIPVSIYWNLSTSYPLGLAMGSVVESAIQQFYVDKDIANGDNQYTELMTRPIMATGNYDNNQFYIGTFTTGSQANITLGGADWSYFFENNEANGTDLDTSKNKTFTVSDGTVTATIKLASNFATIDALVNHINNCLINTGVTAQAQKVNDTQFKITSTSPIGNIVIDGIDKANFFE